ncbi:hypothetical protein PoB_003368700 [Plakobranchus ocellatus]|uniref:Uncharacterized protein n=1 Tax=Plakobranchus ocellatus TaxID=259542 RepID=A0AAV4AJW8_9GAST|nr:hypothetical protein PoB_003368700 [Plakobranchus ocellatus]
MAHLVGQLATKSEARGRGKCEQVSSMPRWCLAGLGLSHNNTGMRVLQTSLIAEVKPIGQAKPGLLVIIWVRGLYKSGTTQSVSQVGSCPLTSTV